MGDFGREEGQEEEVGVGWDSEVEERRFEGWGRDGFVWFHFDGSHEGLAGVWGIAGLWEDAC